MSVRMISLRLTVHSYLSCLLVLKSLCCVFVVSKLFDLLVAHLLPFRLLWQSIGPNIGSESNKKDRGLAILQPLDDCSFVGLV